MELAKGFGLFDLSTVHGILRTEFVSDGAFDVTEHRGLPGVKRPRAFTDCASGAAAAARKVRARRAVPARLRNSGTNGSSRPRNPRRRCIGTNRRAHPSARKGPCALLALVPGSGHEAEQSAVFLLAIGGLQQSLARLGVLFVGRKGPVDSRAGGLESAKQRHLLMPTEPDEQRSHNVFRR